MRRNNLSISSEVSLEITVARMMTASWPERKSGAKPLDIIGYKAIPPSQRDGR
jgi:hypothetical protein